MELVRPQGTTTRERTIFHSAPPSQASHTPRIRQYLQDMRLYTCRKGTGPSGLPQTAYAGSGSWSVHGAAHAIGKGACAAPLQARPPAAPRSEVRHIDSNRADRAKVDFRGEHSGRECCNRTGTVQHSTSLCVTHAELFSENGTPMTAILYAAECVDEPGRQWPRRAPAPCRADVRPPASPLVPPPRRRPRLRPAAPPPLLHPARRPTSPYGSFPSSAGQAGGKAGLPNAQDGPAEPSISGKRPGRAEVTSLRGGEPSSVGSCRGFAAAAAICATARLVRLIVREAVILGVRHGGGHHDLFLRTSTADSVKARDEGVARTPAGSERHRFASNLGNMTNAGGCFPSLREGVGAGGGGGGRSTPRHPAIASRNIGSSRRGLPIATCCCAGCRAAAPCGSITGQTASPAPLLGLVSAEHARASCAELPLGCSTVAVTWGLQANQHSP